MANVILSPNMSLPVPIVSVDPGPDWANNINSSLSIIDGHNHSPGSGVQINPSGININGDLPFNSNNATLLRSIRFSPQAAALSGATDIGCLYEAGVDLYYNDGSGNQIRITQSGSVTGSSGTITGLPSGTASASYSAGTFSFESATNTPATMSIGSVVIGQEVSSGFNVTLAANSGQAANYDLTLPTALPSALNYMTLDNSGNISYNNSGYTGSGAVVLATSPAFSGTTTGVLTGGTYSPTVIYGGASPSSVTASSYTYIRINNIVTVYIAIQFVVGGSSTYVSSVTIPIATSSLAGVTARGYTAYSSGLAAANELSFYTNSSNTAMQAFQYNSSGPTSTTGYFNMAFQYTVS